MSQVQSYFRDKTVFITGATGFVGKLLLEKILRSCYNVNKVYLLVREKKGLQPQERLKKMFSIPAFDKLKNQFPNFNKKIRILNGDIAKPYLGLSREDIDELQECVQIVFHCAATVRFDETLKKAGILNIRSTKYLIEICRNVKKLESFVYVSTAYSNCYKNHVEERVYDSCIKPNTLLNIIDNFDDDTLERLTPIILGDFPNTYTLSKCLAENIISQEGLGLPISIVRPSIVVSSFNEPLRGWNDSLIGIMGLAVATGAGLLKTFNAVSHYKADIVPVDFVVNNIIVAAYDTSKRYFNSKEIEFKVFACVSGNRNSTTWGEYTCKSVSHIRRLPSNLAVWYPTFTIIESYIINNISMFLFHLAPAWFIDAILVLLLKKPRFLHIVNKIKAIDAVLTYFCTNEWQFDDTNTKHLYNGLSEKDKKLFPFDVEELNWDECVSGMAMGARVYLARDPIETLPVARLKIKGLFVLHYVTVAFLLYLLFKVLVFLCQMMHII